MQKANLILIALFVAVLIPLSYAETSGVINSTGNYVSNNTVVTGLYGYTVNSCNNDTDCHGYKCFYDYDSSGSVTTSYGICNATDTKSCRHDGSDTNYANLTFATGTGYCFNSTAYRTCSNGAWSGSAGLCTAGQTCSSGACVSPSSGSPTGGSGPSGLTSGVAVYNISITSYPSSLNLFPGNSTSVNITVKNIGANATLSTIVLSLTGLDSSWYSITPSSIAILSVGNSNSFTIVINVPSSAVVTSYPISLKVTTSNVYALAVANTVLNVLPVPSTYGYINQTYDNYSAVLDSLEGNLSLLEGKSNSDDLAGVQSLVNDARTKINTAGALIKTDDYFNAQLLLNDAKNLIDAATRQLSQIRASAPPAPVAGDNTLYYLAGGILAIIVVAVAYLFWPSRHK